MEIKLRNIDLTDVNILNQIIKVKEEEYEFIQAIIKEDIDNAIEEFYDTLQAKLGLLQKKFNISADDVMKQYYKHVNKIKNRPRRK
jgi:phosphoribosyl-ATP pyrophosphohydrolase